MGTPLRGELTQPTRAPRKLMIDRNLDNIGGVLSRVVRLSGPKSTPDITVSAPVNSEAEDSTAPWSLTVGEAATTESTLFCFLIHLAASRDDVESLKFCLSSEAERDVPGMEEYRISAGGLVNWVNPASGRSPLHVAALNGSVRCVNALLVAGALVHLRDDLGHTPLYYVSLIHLLCSSALDI